MSTRKRSLKDWTITEWKASDNDGVHLGKKTSASLALLREALTDKINDVNETWEDMAGNNEGNKITQNTLSRAVNREKKKSKNGQYKQTKQKVDHSMPIPTLPPPKISYQVVNTNIRPISKPSRVTPPRNQNINNSHSSTTKKNGWGPSIKDVSSKG